MKFSIITPTLNRLEFIKKLIKSIKQQTYNNWELIIVDNGSKDGTVEYIKNLRSSKIKLYIQKKKGFVAKSINKGIKKSNGDWICFLDSDDSFFRNKLEIVKKKIQKKNCDFLFHDLQVYKLFKNTEKKINIMKGRYLKLPVIKDLLINDCPIGLSSVVVKKNILLKIGLINEKADFKQTYDLELWLRIAKVTNNFIYINKVLGGYFLHNHNFQEKNVDISIKENFVHNSFKKILNKKENDLRIARLSYKKARFHTNNKQFDKAINLFLYVIKTGKLNIKIKSIISIVEILFYSFNFNFFFKKL